MPLRLLVEKALALVPEGEEFLPLADAVISASLADREKVWARSGSYSTLGKRIVDPARINELLPAIAGRAQQRLQELFTLVVQAIQEQQSGNLAAAAALLVEAGELEEVDRRFEKAERIYQMALEIARDLREKEPQILALRRLGRLARTAGRLNEAWTYYEQSHDLSVDALNPAGQVIACQGLGNICLDRAQRDLSRSWYERGLKLARELDDPELVWPFYMNLSGLAIQQGEFTEAEIFLAEARAHIDRARDDGAIPFWYNNRGSILLEHGDPAGAERVYREGLAKSSDPFWQMAIRVNLGQALVRQGRLFEAEEEARHAEELAIIHRFIPDMVDVYDLLGSVARARCDEEGFVFYEQALEVCRERDLPPVKEAGVYHGYGRLYQACGRPVEAIAYLSRAREIYAELGLTAELGRVTSDLEDLQT